MVVATIASLVTPWIRTALLEWPPSRTSLATDQLPAEPQAPAPERSGEESDRPASDPRPASEDVESSEDPAGLAVNGPRRAVERRIAVKDPARAASSAAGLIRSRAYRREAPGAVATIGLPILFCRHLC